ncbi:MAG: hypothetical protein QOH06_3227 [Acidobacteriota bacterium]|jgi:hypothetical protein|nr:hypothetical protein [Acidobacteriota bacterium]
MAQASIEEGRLKELLKTAIIEVLEEQRELVLDVFEEALEDVALVRAIDEGDRSPLVSRDEVFKLLERAE